MRGPELTLEPVEQPAEIPWTPWNGGECPLKDEEVEEWEYTLRYGGINKKLVFPSTYRWTHTGGNGDIIAYRVTKWREGFDPVGWKAKCGESLTALQISKSCHEKAETALGNLLAIIHRDGGHYQSEHGAEKAVEEAHQVWSRLISRTEKAEAELALMTLDYDKCRRERGELLNQRDQLLTHPQLSTLRPIAEAGEVPAGCVRVYGQFLEREKRWIATTSQFNDAHFADIHIPESETPEVIHDGGEVFEKVEPVKPTPSTFTAHGKEWTRHVPGDPMPCDGDARVEWLLGSEIEGGYLDLKMKASELVWEYPHAWRYADELGKATSEIIIPPKWTPTVGDVVTLKSGGPKMTVNSIKDGVLCNYFDADGKLNASYFPAATLTKADS